MSFSDRRALRHMKTPVNGIFRVTGFYDVRSATHITGVITAPGIEATAAEHKTDRQGRWAESTELPVVVDQADPAKFVILWDQVDSGSWGEQEMRAARRLAVQINTGQDGTPGSGVSVQFPGQPGVSFVRTVTIGPDGQPAQLSAENAAQVAEVLREKLGGLSIMFNGPGGGFPASGTGFPEPSGGFAPAPGAPGAGFQSGEHGTAVVLDAREMPAQPGFSQPYGGQTELLLEVTRADGTIYQTRTLIAFSAPEHQSAIARPGARLRVQIDPADPSRVAIDPAGLY